MERRWREDGEKILTGNFLYRGKEKKKKKKTEKGRHGILNILRGTPDRVYMEFSRQNININKKLIASCSCGNAAFIYILESILP